LLTEPVGAGSVLVAVVTTLLLAVPSYRAALVTTSGAIAGFFGGAIIIYGYGLNGFLVLTYFFSVSAGASHYRKAEKRERNDEEAEKVGRDAGQAIANIGVAVASVLVVIFQIVEFQTAALFFVGSLAAAAADTAESELGAIWGKHPRLLLGWRKVEPGIDGAVSIQGTLAGILVAAGLAMTAEAVGLVDVRGAMCAVVAGVSATFIESALGSYFQRRGQDPNNWLNTINTFAGAILAVIIYGW
jgi:uncharacterized protein (TIGR00297 family)